MSLHCTWLHYIAANCTRWVQEAPPPVTSDLLPIASIASFVIVDICCCCFWYCWLFCYHQCCWWVVQTLHSQACQSQLDVEVEALFCVDIIVISYSEVFCRWIPRYFLKCNPDLPWWMYLQPWPFMNGRANESDWNPNWFFHCWHIAFLILWTHLTKINQVICVFFRLSWYIN